MVLVDTSIWIEVFRTRTRFSLEEHVPLEEVVTCLPVIQEVLQGFDDEAAFRRAHLAMFSLPILEAPMSRVVFEDAARLYRAARRAGQTIRASTDCLIAICAIRANIEVLHKDRDFKALARVSSLRERSV